MKLKAVPVTSLDDVTLDLEQLQTRSILDSTPQSFLQLLTAGTSRLTSGTSTVSFAAATNTPAVNVSHGLGVKPQRFWTQPTNAFAVPFWVQLDVIANWTTTVVPVVGFSYAAQTATVTFQWFAIG